MNTKAMVAVLQKQKSRLQDQMELIENAIQALEGLDGTSGVNKDAAPKRRRMSAAARKRISQAMKARWAKKKSQK